MSQGSPRVTVRVPAALLAEIDRVVAGSVDRVDGAWDRSSWIVYAIRQALAKRERSRTWRRTRAARAQSPQ
jgi:metal-responsive CopG/Arc/MetJ family transcriptional regulator